MTRAPGGAAGGERDVSEHRSNCICPVDAPGYEDSYGAWEMDSFDVMRAVFAGSVEPSAPFSPLNLPIWIEYDTERATVIVGIFLPRHGDSVIWTAPATAEEAQELREIMTDVWIGRIDAGFPRYPGPPAKTEGEM